MAKEIIELQLKTGNSVSEADKLKKGIKGVGDQTDKTKKSTQELGGTMDSATGGAIGKFKSLKTTLGTVIGSFKSLKVAVIGSGIGALAIGIIAVVQAFKRSEEGQNKFAKIMGVIGAVLGNVMDLLADLGSTIISALESPKKAFESFKKLIKDNIETRITGLLELIPNLGKAISLVFEGKFGEAGKVAVNSLGKVALGVDSVTDAIKNASKSVSDFINQTTAEGKIAGQIADARARADKIDRQLVVDRAKANRDRAELLEKAVDKEKFALQERLEFLREAGRIDEEITNKEIASAQIRLKAKQDENALGLSTKEDLNEEAQLRANLLDLETARLRKAKAVTSQISALRNEENAQLEAEATKKKTKEEEEEKERLAKEEKDKADLLLKLAGLKAVEDEFFKMVAEEEAITEEAKLLLKEQEEIDKITKLQEGLDKETEAYRSAEETKLKIKEFYSGKIAKVEIESGKQEKKRDQILQQQKLKIMADTFGLIADILGKNSTLGKASAIAQATINTYAGITEVFKNPTTIPEPFGTIQKITSAGTILVSGLKAVKSITSQKLPAGAGAGTTSVGSSSPPSLPSAPQSPTFNVVGSSNVDQIADVINSQQQNPTKAYVVSQEVSSRQELDSQIRSASQLI